MCCNSPVSALKQEAERLPEESRILEVLSVPWKAKKQHHYLSGHLPEFRESGHKMDRPEPAAGQPFRVEVLGQNLGIDPWRPHELERSRCMSSNVVSRHLLTPVGFVMMPIRFPTRLCAARSSPSTTSIPVRTIACPPSPDSTLDGPRSEPLDELPGHKEVEGQQREACETCSRMVGTQSSDLHLVAITI